MPEQIDITSAQELTVAINKKEVPGRFLSSFFKKLTHNTRDIDIDFVEGSDTIAPYIRDGEASTVSNRGGFATRTVHCYGISLKRKTTAFDCLKRLPGEVIASGKAMSPEARAAELAGRDMKDLQNKIIRTIEKQVSDAMFTGVVSITDANGNEIGSVNLGMKDSHKIAKTWSTEGYKNIGKDLDDAAVVVAQDSGLTVTDAVFGSSAINEALTNTAFMKQLDTKNVNAGALELTVKRNNLGARYVGMYNGIRIWRYDEKCTIGSESVGMVPANKVLLISEDIQATLHYGIVGDKKVGYFEGEFMADTFSDDDPPCDWLRVRSAPLPIVEQIDGLAFITVS